MGREEAQDKVLRNVDESRRAFLKKLLIGGAFVVPAVASFSMSGIGVEQAQAGYTNMTECYFAGAGTPGYPNCYGQTIYFLEHINESEFRGFVQCFGLTQHGITSLANQYCQRRGLNQGNSW